jgi:hypothetical protein
MTKRRQTFAAWSKQVAKVADELLGLGDCMGEGDPYELAELAKDAYAKGQKPRTFVEEAFEEDLAKREYDAQLAAEAEEEAMYEDE